MIPTRSPVPFMLPLIEQAENQRQMPTNVFADRIKTLQTLQEALVEVSAKSVEIRRQVDHESNVCVWPALVPSAARVRSDRSSK